MTSKAKTLVVLLLFLCVFPENSSASLWGNLSLGVNSEANVYKYVFPYSDSYSYFDFGLNFKDKLANSTRLLGTYTLRDSRYAAWGAKNYTEHLAGINIDQDIMSGLAGILLLQGDYLLYPSNDKYNYMDLSANFAFRVFLFFFEYTNIDIGAKYNNFDYLNYNFSVEGWTPSLSFREEVSSYTGLSPYLAIRQQLSSDIDAELNLMSSTKEYRERPLYSFDGSTYAYTSVYRVDTETNINGKVTLKPLKQLSLSLGANYLGVISNANAKAYDPAATGQTTLAEGYYDRTDLGLSFNCFYYYGEESSYAKIGINYTGKKYLNRIAQDDQGAWTAAKREDNTYSAQVELNQMIGLMFGTNWVLKLSYTYERSYSNDYYYNYSDETFGIIVTSYIYLF